MSELQNPDIANISYTDFIALLHETNRCPGGKMTIRRIRELLHIDKDSRILDVGSNTGFNSFELAHVTPARIDGIDISDSCVSESRRVLADDVEDVRSRVSFQVASAYSIPFPDNTFDVLMVGGATSFMDDKKAAIREYLRVLKPWGFLVSTPLVYHTDPPMRLVDEVSEVLGVKIHPMKKDDWLHAVLNADEHFELYLQESYALNAKSDEDIAKYVDYFLHKEHILKLPDQVRNLIRSRWSETLNVFNENHKYLGFVLSIFRKRHMPEEPELFTTV